MRDIFDEMNELCGTCGDRMGAHYSSFPDYTCPPNSQREKRWRSTGRYRSSDGNTIGFKPNVLLLLLEAK